MSDCSPFNPKKGLAHLTHQPGIYCMLDTQGNILYVGKARHLKKRVSSYFTSSSQNNPKIHALMAQVVHIEVTVTHTENEALLLEHTLIKTHQPRYNILLRDDKSYPYIFLSHHPFPRLGLHRGAKTAKGRYFGPYPNVQAVHQTLNLLQKLFPIRQCQDHFFRHRSRPCLQYQIKRCTAPCVGLIEEPNYQEEVQQAVLFLEGQSQTVITLLIDKMTSAAQALAFEKAAHYRDQIRALRKIQERQYVNTDQGHVDVIAVAIQAGIACVQVLTIRHGQHLGSKAFFPKMPPHLKQGEPEVTDIQSLLSAFLSQYYLTIHQKNRPDEIILSQSIEDMKLLSEVISEQWGQPVQVHSQIRGLRKHWVKMALDNALISLAQHQPNPYRDRLAAFSLFLQLELIPQRLECFDVSHTQGEATVASCVVFDSEGACKSAYRRFNIKNITPGDDYAALREALRRHYSRLKKEDRQLPDILFIDGGMGQVKIAQKVLNELQLPTIRLIGVAKGPHRQSCLESLILLGEERPLILPKNSLALHLIQQIRDEAHRFAITAHRSQRAKVRRVSSLEHIEGLGPNRRQRLIRHFGGLQEISNAGVEDLAAVPGISQQLAQKIYKFFKTT